MIDGFVAGAFLVATPMLATPPFARSVIVVLEHDDTGAIGVMLNSETALPVAEHLPNLAASASPPDVLFIGGPVSNEIAIVLGQSSEASFLRPTPFANIGILDPEHLPDSFDSLRVFSGYAGWDSGQLEDEIDEGGWWVIEADTDELFTDDPGPMWQRTVARGPGTIPFHTTYPPQVELN